jgi:NCS1 family nucleobase:cation symporter-1
VVIGNLIGVFFLGMLSTFGPQLGIPQLIQSRRAFGFAGNYLPAALNFIAGVGWFAVNTVLGVFALDWIFHLGFVVSLIIMAIIQIVFAIYGYNLIHAFEKFMAVVLTILFIIVTVFALQHINPGFAMNAKAPAFSGLSGSLILSIGVAFSYILGWMAFASDYTRYLPKDVSASKVFWNVFLSTLISCVWIEGLGVGLATIRAISVPTDLATNLLPYSLGIFAMIAVVIGTITANVLNIYSGALSILAIDLSAIRAIFPKRWVAALVLGILGTILCLVGQSGYYNQVRGFSSAPGLLGGPLVGRGLFRLPGRSPRPAGAVALLQPFQGDWPRFLGISDRYCGLGTLFQPGTLHRGDCQRPSRAG